MPQKRHSSHRLNALRSEAGVSCLQLMKLENIAAKNFFKPLVLPVPLLFMEALLDLHEYIYSHFPDNRCPTKFAVDEMEKVVKFFNKRVGETSELYSKDSRYRALHIMSDLSRYGYVDKEYENQEEYICFTMEAEQVIDLLLYMQGQSDTQTYTAQLYSIYQVLNFSISDLQNMIRNHDAYAQIYQSLLKQSHDFFTALNRMNSNIKRFMESSVDIHDVNSICKNVNEFLEQNGPFHSLMQLNRQKNHYRHFIEQSLASILAEEDEGHLLEEFIQGYIAEHGATYTDARSEILQQLTTLHTEFMKSYFDKRIDRLLSRITSYFNKLKTKSQILADNEKINQEELNLLLKHFDELDDNLTDSLFNFTTQHVINPDVIFNRRQKPRKSVINIKPIPFTQEEIERRLDEEERSLETDNKYSMEHVNEFIGRLLGKFTYITDENYPMNSKDDAYMLSSAYFYSNDGDAIYTMMTFEDTCEKNGISFNKFIIIRKDI